MRLRLPEAAVAALLTLVVVSPAMGQVPRSFTPESGPAGTLVKIIGERLDTVKEVRFNGVASPSVRIVSAQHLKAEVPEGASSGPIELVGPGGAIIETGRAFTVVLPATPQPRLFLAPPRPSPATGSVTIAFSLATPGRAQLAVFDVRGRQARAIVDQDLPAGPHERLWNGTDGEGRPVESGIYFVQLRTGGQSLLKRVAMIRE